jgi:hypothetical protein
MSKAKSEATKLTMNRNGDFQVRATGDRHCGVLEDLNVKYAMICECDAKLDERGFLFDQINVDNFFKSIRRTELSCEDLCMDCVRKLLVLIKEENPKCVIRKMSLTLSPQPFAASMTFEYEAPATTKARKPFIAI